MKIFNRKKRAVFIRILGFCILFYLLGCLTPRMLYDKRVDETNHPKWWGHLHKGEILLLKQDALIGKEGLRLSARVTADHGAFGVRITVDQYRLNPDQYKLLGIHLIPKGTRVKCVRLERFFTFEDSYYFVYVEILDGDLKEQLTVVPSTGDTRKPGTLMLNAPFLEPVQE